MTDMMETLVTTAVRNIFQKDENRKMSNNTITYSNGNAIFDVKPGSELYDELMLVNQYLEAEKVANSLHELGIDVTLPNKPDSDFLNTEKYSMYEAIDVPSRYIKLTCKCSINFGDLIDISNKLEKAIDLGCTVDIDSIVSTIIENIKNGTSFKYLDETDNSVNDRITIDENSYE